MEKDLEKALLEQLQNQEYEYINIAGPQDLKENLKKQIGNKLEVLIEDESFDGKYYIARSENEVPDIDGIIYVEKSEDELLDKFVKVEIIGNKDYDMIGKLIK